MKRTHILVAALLAVFAVSVVSATAASAAVEFLLALWLEGTSPVTATLLVESEGELELSAGAVKVLCSGILIGWVGPESLNFVSELLSLAGGAISLTKLVAPELVCTSDAGCETTPLVWAINLPWETEVELMVEGTETFFANLLLTGGAGSPGWAVECRVLGLSVENECTSAETAVQLTNEANGTVDSTFSDTFQALAGLKLANCTVTGNESGEVSGLGITLEAGVTLSVSSE